jgi:hypothetical protein
MKPTIIMPFAEKRVSPQDYRRVAKQQRRNIKCVEIVPPKLGTAGFGGLLVRFKTPVLF